MANLAERIAAGESLRFADFPEEYQADGHGSGGIFWIDWFCVPAVLRRKGHGRAFYQAFERWILDCDTPTAEIRLMAADPGDGPSDEFWRKMGYVYLYPDADDYERQHFMVKRFPVGEPQC